MTVDGTRAALQVARDAQVARFVNCGSEAALLAGDPLIDVDETRAAAAGLAGSVLRNQGAGRGTWCWTRTRRISPPCRSGPDSSGDPEAPDRRPRARGPQRRVRLDRGGRHTTDITFVDNAVEGLRPGWRHGRPGQAYFITDQHPVQPPRVHADRIRHLRRRHPDPRHRPATAAQVFRCLHAGSSEQTCTLRTDKAVANSATGRSYPGRRRSTSCVDPDSPRAPRGPLSCKVMPKAKACQLAAVAAPAALREQARGRIGDEPTGSRLLELTQSSARHLSESSGDPAS